MTLTQDDLSAIRDVVKEELEPVKRDLKKLKKDTKYMIGVLDKEVMKHAKWLDRVEDVLHLPPIRE